MTPSALFSMEVTHGTDLVQKLELETTPGLLAGIAIVVIATLCCLRVFLAVDRNSHSLTTHSTGFSVLWLGR